ncbi:acetolactate synthase small subunit [Paenibacillus sp.]|uniref:acetolactate synthase small subunit n=1 Tax=Paenibacillus sp. TaxID=58172 RepID=UPI002D709617|nr:acetolactate synthase small subunit [Paenibacillus sp.]HZG56441.1 acetolactate synthase small subunit [Paenibacillus sp.]
MRATLSLLTADQPGVLQRVAGLFSRRGYNIESIAVGPCEREGCARMTIVTEAPGGSVPQAVHQIRKLIDVYEVDALEEPAIARQCMLVRLRMSPGEERAERLRQWTQAFPCTVLSVRDDIVVLQLVATSSQNRAFVALVSDMVLQVASAGEVAVPL